MTGMPPDPFNQLVAGAISLFEMFESLVKAGFKEEHALYLIGQLIAAAMKNE